MALPDCSDDLDLHSEGEESPASKDTLDGMEAMLTDNCVTIEVLEDTIKKALLEFMAETMRPEICDLRAQLTSHVDAAHKGILRQLHKGGGWTVGQPYPNSRRRRASEYSILSATSHKPWGLDDATSQIPLPTTPKPFLPGELKDKGLSDEPLDEKANSRMTPPPPPSDSPPPPLMPDAPPCEQAARRFSLARKEEFEALRASVRSHEVLQEQPRVWESTASADSQEESPMPTPRDHEVDSNETPKTPPGRGSAHGLGDSLDFQLSTVSMRGGGWGQKRRRTAVKGWDVYEEPPSETMRNGLQRLGSILRETKIKDVVESSYFEVANVILIGINALVIGLQTNYMASNRTDKVPQGYAIVDSLFCALFTTELSMRLWAYGWRLYVNEGWAWGVFDTVIVGLQLVEEVFRIVAESSGGAGSTMRTLRMLRLCRAVRIFRVLRYFKELRVIVISILGSFRSLFWTLVLLFFAMYVIGIFFTQVVTDDAVAKGLGRDDPHLLSKYFGTLMRSILSLYQAMTGGYDWDDVCSPLIEEISPLHGFLFSLYIAFSVLALMNVVTGVFVDSALTTAREAEKEVMKHSLRNFFLRADEDGTGRLSPAKMQAEFSKVDVHKYLKSVDVDPDDAIQMYYLLETDKAGYVQCDQMIDQCMKLRHGASAVDVMTILHHVTTLATDLRVKLNILEEQVQDTSERMRSDRPYGSVRTAASTFMPRSSSRYVSGMGSSMPRQSSKGSAVGGREAEVGRKTRRTRDLRSKKSTRNS